MITPIELIGNVIDKKPGEAAENFADLVLDRIQDVVAAKRIEVAKNLFGYDHPEVEDEPTETNDNNEPEETETEEPATV